jgi:hypothetical protein
MSTERLPFFLALARDWRAAAVTLLAAGVPDHDPALRVWREAAWCHVLFARDQYHPALASLRTVVQAVTGETPGFIPPLLTRAEAMTMAADLFDRLRNTVSARHPHSFGGPAAA